MKPRRRVIGLSPYSLGPVSSAMAGITTTGEGENMDALVLVLVVLILLAVTGHLKL